MKTAYLLMLPIRPVYVNEVYARGVPLPLHCTVMHWFPQRTSQAVIVLEAWLQGLARDTKPIELVSDKPDLFGPDENVPVHTLVRNSELCLLHTKIFQFLVSTRSEPSELRWAGAGYRPHVTTIGSDAFTPGKRFTATSLALVDHDAEGVKRIIAQFPLGE